MKYKSIDLLDAKIERIISRNVKYYYTDWKNYDRPYYMKLKGIKEKNIILIVRESGTYLYTLDDLYNYEFSRTVCTYYGESVKYYSIDLINLELKQLKFEEVKHLIKTIEIDLKRKELSA